MCVHYSHPFNSVFVDMKTYPEVFAKGEIDAEEFKN